MANPTFPQLSEEAMRRRLAPPAGPVRVVIDTDTNNEIDDQFALTWALLSQDQLHIEAIYAAPYSFGIHRDGLLQAHALLQAGGPETNLGPLERYRGWLQGLEEAGIHPADVPFVDPAEGMERSYQEILRVFAKLGQDPAGRVFRGSDRYLPAPTEPVRSPAAEDLVQRALAGGEDPLYVVAIGCVTNIASALLLAPEIVRHIVVIWTAGYPTWVTIPNPSFNLEQDLPASQLLFDSGVPHVYLPGFYIGAQLRLSLPEMEAWVRGRGAIGDYLYELYTHNPIHAQRGIRDHFGRTWIIWDLITIAWLLNPAWVPSHLVRAPVLRADTTWQSNVPGRHLMREAYEIDRDAIFRDFLTKLEQAATP